MIEHRARPRPPLGRAFRANRAFGRQLDVWVPMGTRLQPAQGQTGLATVDPSYGSSAAGRYGPELRKSTADYMPALTITPRPGAGYECWLVVMGAGVTTWTGSSSFVGNTTSNGLMANGLGVRLRAASSDILTSTLGVPQPYEPLFFRNWDGRHILQRRGERLTNASGWGTYFANDGLSMQGDTLSLLARWTDETPSDGQIAQLLADPWQIIEPLQVWAAAGGATVDNTALWLQSTGQIVRAGSADGSRRLYMLTDGTVSAASSAPAGSRPMRLVDGATLAGPS